MKSTTILLCLGLLLCVSSAPHKFTVPDNARELYEEFKLKYKKNQENSEDDEERFEIFKDNLIRIQEAQQNELGTAEYGITMFADLTPEEFTERMSTIPRDMDLTSIPMENMDDLPNAPSSFDWRKKGAVTPVEFQVGCSTCWAFSVVGNIESHWFLKHGELFVLSKQQLVDCDKVNARHEGGHPISALHEIMRFGGLMLQSDYPYECDYPYNKTLPCRMVKDKVVAKVRVTLRLNNDEDKQASWLAQTGPFSSCLHDAPLQFYKSGILRPDNCPKALSHAALTVGYGEENGTPYWIVKNSYSRYHGEEGYFRIYRGDGTCGINLLCTSAAV